MEANGAGREIVIRGGHPLKGSVTTGGSKNFVLPALAATILTSEEVVLDNVPVLEDVYTMLLLLEALGAEVDPSPGEHARWAEELSGHHRVVVKAHDIRPIVWDEHPGLMKRVRKMRASFLTFAPVLMRCGQAVQPEPGGDQIGRRPIDVDIRGIEALGARFDSTEKLIVAEMEKSHGSLIYMDYPSHTGTEHLLMAACLVQGRTTIIHAACEPEIVALGTMLNRMGAEITGLGTSTIVVDGVPRLHGTSETIIPDRLEAATYAIASAITGGIVEIRGVRPRDMLPLTIKLRDAGVKVWTYGDEMLVQAADSLVAVPEIQALPFPGFPTDYQAMFATLMTQAHGETRLYERVFDERLKYLDWLQKMGARVELDKSYVSTGEADTLSFGEAHARVEREGPFGSLVKIERGEAVLETLSPSFGTRATIHGPSPLTGTHVVSDDIRAGAALVLAALAAQGETVIDDSDYHLDRGYEDVHGKLASLGAHISVESGA